MKKILSIIIVCMLVSAFAAGCGSKDQNTIKVGINYELSGAVATYGQASLDGIKMAVDEINAAGGINGKKVELVQYDNKSEAAEATTLATKLMTSDKVVAVLGPATSGAFKATIPVANKNKVPVISGSATADDVTVDENGVVKEYAFRICFNDSYQGITMATFAANNLGAKTAAIYADSSSDYAKGLSENFKKTFPGTIVTEVSYVAGDTDFNAVLTSLKDKQFDVLFIPGYYEEVGLIIKQARALGIDCPVLGADGFDSPVLLELAGADALHDVYFSNHYSSLDEDPVVQEFIAAFTKKYNESPNAFHAMGYDEANFLFEAIARCGDNITGEAVKAQLEATSNFVGVTGSFAVDPATHNPIKSIVVIELQNGEQVSSLKVGG